MWGEGEELQPWVAKTVCFPALMLGFFLTNSKSAARKQMIRTLLVWCCIHSLKSASAKPSRCKKRVRMTLLMSAVALSVGLVMVRLVGEESDGDGGGGGVGGGGEGESGTGDDDEETTTGGCCSRWTCCFGRRRRRRRRRPTRGSLHEGLLGDINLSEVSDRTLLRGIEESDAKTKAFRAAFEKRQGGGAMCSTPTAKHVLV